MSQRLRLSVMIVDQFDSVRVASVLDPRELPRVVYLSRMVGGVQSWELPGLAVTLEARGDFLECVIEQKQQVIAIAAQRAA